MSLNALKWLLIVCCVLGVVGGFSYQDWRYKGLIRGLNNQLAEKDKTIETKNGIFTKLTIETDDVKDLLVAKEKEVITLKREITENKAKLFAVSDLNIKLKKDYEDLSKSKQTELPNNRTKVEFDKDFGFLRVNGYTLTNPGETYLHLSQSQPLKLALAITQDVNGKWKTLVSTNQQNLSINIDLTAVNPMLSKRKWYELIGIQGIVGGGSVANNTAALMGLGLSLDVDKFSIGPSVLFPSSGLKDRYYALSVTWRPFLKN